MAPAMTTGFLPTRSDTNPDIYTATAKAPPITKIMRPIAAAGFPTPQSPEERKARRFGMMLWR